MAASRADIEGWFDAGIADGCSHLIVVCDTFDHDDYPVYVHKDDRFYDIYDRYKDGQNMQRVMEVYDLAFDKAHQMKEHRALRLPPRAPDSAGEKHGG